MLFKRGRGLTGYPFVMRDRSTGAVITSGTVTGRIVKDGGTQTTLAAAPVHKGNGQWTVDLTDAEMDAALIGLLFTHANGETDRMIKTELVDGQDTARFGLTALPSALPDTAGGLLVVDGDNGVAVGGIDAQAIWDFALNDMQAPDSIGFKLAQWNPGVVQTGDAFARLGTPANTSIAGDLAVAASGITTVAANVDTVLARLPSALVNGRLDASVGALNADEDAAKALARGAAGIIFGTCNSGSTATIVQTLDLDPVAVAPDQFKDRLLVFARNTASPALRGVGLPIKAVTLGGAVTLVAALPAAPVLGDLFAIL